MHPMHPYLMERLAAEHRRDLRQEARRAGRAGPQQRREPRPSARYRAGWALIEIGLRLAGTTGDA